MTNSRFKLTPALRAVIAQSAARIFGNLPVVPYRTGNKLFKQKPVGPLAASHYPADLTRTFKDLAPDFETDLEARRKAALVKLRRTGRGPPKKGQGKRATKKK